MKKSTQLIPLLIAAFCAPLAASALLQSPNSAGSGAYCPDLGVKTIDATFTPTLMASCEYGFVKYEGFGLNLSWEEPICPAMVVFEPVYSATVSKPNMRFEYVDSSTAVAIEFCCNEKTEACIHSGTHDLPGFYPFYIEIPCEY